MSGNRRSFMNDQLMNLSSLFNNTVLRIPDYQRGYAWTKKEYEDFWDDLINLESKKKYYAGVITFEDVKELTYESESWMHDAWLIKNKAYRPLFIVDGQQRITTSILIIQAIVNIVKEKYSGSQINYYDIKTIESNYLYEFKGNSNNFSVKFGYEKNNPCYGFLIKEIYSPIDNDQITVIKTKYSENIKAAYEYFKEQINLLEFNEIESIFTKLTQSFLYNVYNIKDEIDVFVTFETMNNRGKRLSSLELLKNRLIYLTTLFPESEIDVNANRLLRSKIDNCWKDIYYYLGKNHTRMLEDEEFLYIHSTLYFPDFPESEYFRGANNIQYNNEILLRKIFTPQKVREKTLNVDRIESFISSLGNSVKDWYYINFPLDSDYTIEIKEYLLKLNELQKLISKNYELRFRWTYTFGGSSTYLLERVYHFFRKNNENKIRLKWLKEVEKSVYLSCLFSVGSYYYRGVVQHLDNINKQNDKENVTKMICILEEYRKEYWRLNSQELIKTFKKIISSEKGYYKSSFPLRYFLAEYEISTIKKSKNVYKIEDLYELYSNELYTIEHIYPSNARVPYWTKIYKEFNDRQKKKLRNSLGNLVLISGKKNEKLANKSFPEKKGNNQNKLGFKYGCLSEVELCDYDNWTPVEIKDRGIKLLNFVHERWDIRISRRIDKIEMLGIDFLEQQSKSKA
ncbi:hypothetical protein CD798_17115 [Bacillaceae bacterium SAOS 7]|nr:hypothetical protein CD798_17115 [Bacillaceae bacterium SAOS 7]